MENLLTTRNLPAGSSTSLRLLHICILNNALSQGKIVDSFIAHGQFAFGSCTSFQNKLINMYAKCGSLVDAQKVFDLMRVRDVISWNTLIAGYGRHGHLHETLRVFRQMQRIPLQPDQFTFASLIPAYAKMGTLELSMGIYQSVIDRGISLNGVVATAMVDMLAKCGSIDKASELFDRIPQKDVISWNAMIAGYAQNGLLEKALDTFKQMQLAGVKPDTATFASVLRVCAATGASEEGKGIHRSITEGGFLSDVVVATALVDMYAKCGSIDSARQLFDGMPQRDVISWNAMIAGYTQNGVLDEALTLFKEIPRKNVSSWNVVIAGCAQNGFAEKALETFKQMTLAGVKPNSTTFASILPACTKMGALQQGTDIYRSILEGGFSSDVVVASAMVDMFAKCGSLDKAQELFDKMPDRNVVSWNAMIAGYAQNGSTGKALQTLKKMYLADVKPHSSTFAGILPACAKMGALEQGTDIHRSIIEGGFLSDVVVASALVDMYAKCGSIDKASKLFNELPQRNVVSWNAMTAGYVQNGFVEKAFETCKQMQLAGVKLNSSTFVSILPACAQIGALEEGLGIHQSITESGLWLDVVVASSLIDMYTKCGSMDKARQLFDRMPQRDVISWTAIIVGYAQNGSPEKAIKTFKQMQLAGINPDSTTFASILPACGKMGALEQGVDIHQRITEGGFLSDVVSASALVDMYAKCGSINKAREVFDKMSRKNLVSWNAMISGYAHNGFCNDALKFFELMKHSITYPDNVSFACVLFACSHAGFVHEGCTYFNQMSKHYCITPIVDHYACMVDLLARAGYLEDALKFIVKMPVKPMVVVWMCFLGACRSHMNIGLGVYTATVLFDLDPKNAATYVLLSNIYAKVGRWSEVQMVRRLMKDTGIKKTLGCSWIEAHKMVHTFSVGDRSHPQMHEIYAMLDKLTWEMKGAGYFPDSGHSLNDVEEEEKELFLCHHSEKLAIAFGLLNTPSGTTIRVFKNLRVCTDCHTATKVFSKITAREIVVRDANRFHHFKQGKCSCKDYW